MENVIMRVRKNKGERKNYASSVQLLLFCRLDKYKINLIKLHHFLTKYHSNVKGHNQSLSCPSIDSMMFIGLIYASPVSFLAFSPNEGRAATSE